MLSVWFSDCFAALAQERKEEGGRRRHRGGGPAGHHEGGLGVRDGGSGRRRLSQMDPNYWPSDGRKLFQQAFFSMAPCSKFVETLGMMYFKKVLVRSRRDGTNPNYMMLNTCSRRRSGIGRARMCEQMGRPSCSGCNRATYNAAEGARRTSGQTNA